MKITVEIDDAIGERIDLEARKDGHSNRNAVIRKMLNIFFENEVNYRQPTNTDAFGQEKKQGKKDITE